MSRTFLVTGANRGLGLEFARQLSARGDTVVATARRPDDARELRDTGARVEALDVGAADSILALGEALAGLPIDVLINNAGQGVGGRLFEDEDLDSLEGFFRINVLGPARLAQRLLPNLRAGAARTIVNVTSKMGSIEDNTSGGAHGYRTSKAALNMLTKGMSIDLRREGFTCIVIHPGWVATDMGGSGAPLTAQESVRGMLEVIDGLRAADTGRFFDYQGEIVPW
jgi:NAD(P)-dependent dehydrogenase (short-subunit alcohol dehydrogenase family)